MLSRFSSVSSKLFAHLKTPSSTTIRVSQNRFLLEIPFQKFESNNQQNKESKWRHLDFNRIISLISIITSGTALYISMYQTTATQDNAAQSEQTKQKHLEEQIEDTLNQKFQTRIPSIPGLELLEKRGAEVLPSLCAHNCIPQLSLIEGPSNAGKSVTLEKSLEGRKNVVYISLRNNASREALMSALGIHNIQANLTVPEMMLALKKILVRCKEKPISENNPLPIIVISDYISNDHYCNIIAGYVLQFVEEQLASGIHVSSNPSTCSELKTLSGHSSRLTRYVFSYPLEESMNQHEFLTRPELNYLEVIWVNYWIV